MQRCHLSPVSPFVIRCLISGFVSLVRIITCSISISIITAVAVAVIQSSLIESERLEVAFSGIARRRYLFIFRNVLHFHLCSLHIISFLTNLILMFA